MFFPPQPRMRLYGCPENYGTVLKDVATGGVQRGDDVAALEREVAALIGVRHAVAMPRARVGIHFAIKALIRPGQKVILSPYTIYDVVNMVISAGGCPVFADIERETCNISASAVEALLDDQTGAVMVTHLHGLACDIERIAELCRARGVALIEDTAQAFGGSVNGRRLGSFGTAGIFSFGMAKNINCFYGGMVVTEDDALHAALRRAVEELPLIGLGEIAKRIAFCLVGDVLTWPPVFWTSTFWLFRHGYLNDIEALNKRWRGEDDPVLRETIPTGYLTRLTPMQARMVRRQLDDVDTDSAVRIGYALLYHEGLAGLPGIILPPWREDGSHIYLAYPVQVEDRHALLRFLMTRGRDLTVQHIGNCADYPSFARWARPCPNARLTGDQTLLLPTYPQYGAQEVLRNVALIREYLSRPQGR